MLGAQVVEASNQLHNALLLIKWSDYNHTRRSTTGNTVTQDRADKTAGPRPFIKSKTSAQGLAIGRRRKPSSSMLEIRNHASQPPMRPDAEALKHVT